MGRPKRVMIDGKLQCNKCKQWKLPEEFHIANGENYGRQHHCKLCATVKQGEYTAEAAWKVFSYYGLSCECCGESNIGFLTIAHTNDDGAAHRRSLTGGAANGGWGFYVWLIKNDFPEGFHTECGNCNLGKEINRGVCPHKDIEKACEI